MLDVVFAIAFSVILITPVVLVYLVVIKGADRYEPEPWWLLGLCFFWGVFGATFFAILGNAVGEAFVELGLGGIATQQTMASTTASFVAPPVEESTKGAILLLVWALSALWLKELDGPLDGAIYGGMVGLGFTLTEDVLYVTSATLQQGVGTGQLVFFLRTILGGLGHASFTAMTGIGIGIAAESRSVLVKLVVPIGGWMAAVGLHFLHNFLVTFWLAEGLGLLLKFLVFWTFGLVFFVLLYVLVLRDRAIVIRGLVDEVGKLLHPREFQRTIGYSMVIPLFNALSLLGSPGGYFRARQKQLDLVKLAFVKQRLARGEPEQAWADRLRDRIRQANAAGIFIGPR